MHQDSILIIGEGRHWYHKLRGELRATQYRVLRARNARVAEWLMERVKIALVVVAPNEGVAEGVAEAVAEDELGGADWDEAASSVDARDPSGREASTMLIRRTQAVEWAECGSMLDGGHEAGPYGIVQESALKLAASSWIPTLFITSSHGAGLESHLSAAIARRADYILFSPYEQTELMQAIRTAMLNGPAPEQETEPRPVEISLQDRMSSLVASREQLARLLVGAVEQLAQARARVSWCESEIRALRQARVQHELVTQSQTQGLPEVVHGVAHDFANLLEAAGTAATALYSQPHSPALYRDAMRGVMEQSQELIEALTELTDAGRESWHTEPVELDGLVTKALMSALVPLRDPQIRVRVRMGGLEPVWAHRSLVYRALANLVWNAVQAMPGGGMLSILGYVRGDRVVIEVGDTGVGIAARERSRVLRQPFSTKPGHRGMGLTMVRELIEKCGGEITFTSRPKHGSLFSIALPVVKRTGVARPRPAEQVKMSPRPVLAMGKAGERGRRPARAVRHISSAAGQDSGASASVPVVLQH